MKCCDTLGISRTEKNKIVENQKENRKFFRSHMDGIIVTCMLYGLRLFHSLFREKKS